MFLPTFSMFPIFSHMLRLLQRPPPVARQAREALQMAMEAVEAMAEGRCRGGNDRTLFTEPWEPWLLWGIYSLLWPEFNLVKYYNPDFMVKNQGT